MVRLNWRSLCAWTALALVIKAGLAAFISHHVTPGDEARYTGQATSLLAGHGFSDEDGPVTHLPPGYPIFLAAILGSLGDAYVVTAQVVVTSVAVGALCAVLASYSWRWAVVAVLTLAVHPHAVTMNTVRLSENLSICAAVVVVVLLHRLQNGVRNPIVPFLLGATLMGLPLIAPGMVFVAAFLAVAIGWVYRSWRNIVWMTAGAVAVLVPWQVHCVKAVGHPVASLYTTGRWGGISDRFFWYRTWIRTGTDVNAFFVVDRIRDIDHAYRSPEEKQRVITALDEAQRTGDDADFNRLLYSIAEERVRENPVRHYLILPSLRCAALWLTPIPFRTCLNDVGEVYYKDSGHATTRGLIATAYVALHILLLVAFLAGCYRTLRSPSWIGLSILAGIIVYTAASGYLGGIESRRNLPFLPLLLYMPFAHGIPIRRTDTDANLPS